MIEGWRREKMGKEKVGGGKVGMYCAVLKFF